jgi:serine/threonine-protein kinase
MLGLPFLFGVNVQSKPYILVTEFYGIGGQCVTIGHAAKKLSLEAKEWAFILEKCAGALAHIHEKGLIHCDIKHNNIILKNSADVREPVIIDFGKMKKAESAKICKLNSKEQDRYLKYYKHIAPEIIWGRRAPSTASDIYSFGQIISLVVYYTKSTDLQKIAKKCIHGTPEKRPKAFNVALEFKEVSNN